MSSSSVRAVFFDAVGTLIHPQPSAVEVYHDIGRRFGSQLSPDVMAARFRSAWIREDESDRLADWKTSEVRERERWKRIVATVLDDVADGEACFRELWQHFGQSQAWRIEPGLEAVLADLKDRGLALGVASNFDGRLRRVLAGMAPLRSLWRLVISSEVGWRKPASQFFANLRKVTGFSGSQIVMVGDDRTNDIEGARAAGLRAILLDDDATRLSDLPSMLERLG